MTMKSLGEVAKFVNGAAFKPTDWGDEGLPIIRIQNLTGTGEKFNYTKRAVKPELLVNPGDLLVSWSATLDVYRWNGPQGLLNQHIFKVLPNEGVDPEYLYFALKSVIAELSSKTHGSTMKHVVRGDFESTRVRLPSLAEQRRIVDLLSRAESIVRLRREGQQKAAELVPAIFLDMFGDPATNPKGWPTTKLGDYLAINSSVRTPDLNSEAGMPCIGADSIESGTGKIVSWPTVGEIRPISGKYLFEVGDVLYSKIRPALRKVIVAPTSGYCSADMYPLRAAAGTAIPEYVAALLLSNAFTEYAVGVSARAQMPKVNRETLFAYEHPLPPLSLQKVFAERVQAISSIAKQQASATDGAELAFESLLARSFVTGG